MADRLRSYDVARKTFSFLEFIGWSVVVLGIFVGLILASSAGRYAGDGQKFLLFLTGASGSLIGLFLVGAVQNWRAGVDSAEYGQQALKVAREQLEISKQSLKRQDTDSRSFSAQKAVVGEKPGASFERTEPSLSRQSNGEDPGRHRGHNIYHIGSTYRAVGQVFPTHADAVAAIDAKLDVPAIENKNEVPIASIVEPNPGQEAEIEVGETKSSIEPAHTITEENGKFFYGRMAFSSREAAEKYVRQLGVNPNFRS
ncbi:hypothetical protein [Aliiroseovarius sp. F47248L]|uniref:hypothetical protein n=1 Tax=Aliiroseovarius sp. F47248L TaxID=2926420 RepID=UPI001FF226C5|nr:hypothetical protein [Aliiroseovarius sp. F47248L]MCK0138925.1 hypothetical protein [Aliiroseovarius sp. F47248L]